MVQSDFDFDYQSYPVWDGNRRVWARRRDFREDEVKHAVTGQRVYDDQIIALYDWENEA